MHLFRLFYGWLSLCNRQLLKSYRYVTVMSQSFACHTWPSSFTQFLFIYEPLYPYTTQRSPSCPVVANTGVSYTIPEHIF